MAIDQEPLQTIECPCGTVFEPENIEVDRYGERVAKCPKCRRKLTLPVES